MADVRVTDDGYEKLVNQILNRMLDSHEHWRWTSPFCDALHKDYQPFMEKSAKEYLARKEFLDWLAFQVHVELACKRGSYWWFTA